MFGSLFKSPPPDDKFSVILRVIEERGEQYGNDRPIFQKRVKSIKDQLSTMVMPKLITYAEKNEIKYDSSNEYSLLDLTVTTGAITYISFNVYHPNHATDKNIFLNANEFYDKYKKDTEESSIWHNFIEAIHNGEVLPGNLSIHFDLTKLKNAEVKGGRRKMSRKYRKSKSKHGRGTRPKTYRRRKSKRSRVHQRNK